MFKKSILRDLEDEDVFTNLQEVYNSTDEKISEVLSSHPNLKIIGKSKKILASNGSKVLDALIVYRVAGTGKNSALLSVPIRYRKGVASTVDKFFIIKEGRKVEPRGMSMKAFDKTVANFEEPNVKFNPFTGMFSAVRRTAKKIIAQDDNPKNDNPKEEVIKKAPEFKYLKRLPSEEGLKYDETGGKKYYIPVEDLSLKRIANRLDDIGKELELVKEKIAEETKRIEQMYGEKEEALKKEALDLAKKAFEKHSDVVNIVMGVKDNLFILSQQVKTREVVPTAQQILDYILAELDPDGSLQKFINDYIQTAKKTIKTIEEKAIIVSPKPEVWEKKAAKDTLLVLLSTLDRLGGVLREKLERVYDATTEILDKVGETVPEANFAFARKRTAINEKDFEDAVLEKIYRLHQAGFVDDEDFCVFAEK
jgi:hypothetical protein